MINEIIEKAKKENKKVYIYAHKFPDGDAISSARAIEKYLRNQGIYARYIVTNQVRAFSKVVGNIPVTSNVDKDEISLILDTRSVDYAENNLFKNSTLEDTYVIDHHEKVDGVRCIEEELGLSSQNVIRDSKASSVCEILANELEQEKITPQIANILTLGLLTDTAKLKYLKKDTLQNVSKLIKLGANYQQIIDFCAKKNNLKEEVGLARTLLKTEKFPIGDTFGMIISLDNKEVKDLNKIYHVRSPQKKIFKMLGIENCSFNCMMAQNTPDSKYDAEFRSTPTYADLDVLQLATHYKGGGHYHASGCVIKAENKTDIETQLKQQTSQLYAKQATNLPTINLSKQDSELAEILDKTKRLTKGVTPEILSKVDELVQNGVNYEYLFSPPKSFEKFMLENEILSKIPSSVYNNKNPHVNINISSKEMNKLEQKYHVGEEEVLEGINLFSNINIGSATISLPNGSSTHMDRNGNITKSESDVTRDVTTDITK